jgi:hypothetical protein
MEVQMKLTVKKTSENAGATSSQTVKGTASTCALPCSVTEGAVTTLWMTFTAASDRRSFLVTIQLAHLMSAWRAEKVLYCVRNVMAHGDAREGKWRGNWRMEWVASTLHTTSESSITTADAHTSASSSRLNRRPRRFNPLAPEFSFKF